MRIGLFWSDNYLLDMPGKPPIGFALVTYRDESNTHRLIATLDRVFDRPPITIHHDFSKSPLDVSRFGSNVKLLDRTYRTGWGTMETVLAMAGSIGHLMNRSDGPRWFYLITGHCYPIVSAEQALERLDSTGVDLFMKQSPFYPPVPGEPRTEEWCERYVYPSVRLTLPNRRGKLGQRHVTLRRSAGATPFSTAYPCRSGPTYFTGNETAAAALAEGFRNKELLKWFRSRQIVDEALFQTILGNAPGLKIFDDDLRFIKWPDLTIEPDEEKPKTLRIEDAPEIAASDAHIARKFLPGRSDELIAWIDRERLRIS